MHRFMKRLVRFGLISWQFDSSNRGRTARDGLVERGCERNGTASTDAHVDGGLSTAACWIGRSGSVLGQRCIDPVNVTLHTTR